MFHRDAETEERAKNLLGWTDEKIRRTRLIDIRAILSDLPQDTPPEQVGRLPIAGEPVDCCSHTSSPRALSPPPHPEAISTPDVQESGMFREVLNIQPEVTATCEVYVRLVRVLNEFFFASLRSVVLADFRRARAFLYTDEEAEHLLSTRQKLLDQMERVLEHCTSFHKDMNESIHVRQTERDVLNTTSSNTTDLICIYQKMLSDHVDRLREVLVWVSG